MDLLVRDTAVAVVVPQARRVEVLDREAMALLAL